MLTELRAESQITIPESIIFSLIALMYLPLRKTKIWIEKPLTAS